MLVNSDAKALEWVCALFLSQDPTGIKEYKDGVDVHAANREAFNLPSRLIAKTYLFRLIYGGSAFAYAHDPDFASASSSERYWQSVIDKTYLKYKGLGAWHTKLMQEVVNSGRLVMPTGRVYSFKREQGKDFPRTQILNYPVQGLGADLMSIARVSLYRRMHQANLKSLLVCTIHDSILVDGPEEEVAKVVQLMYDVFRDIPLNFKRLFGIDFNLPVRCEIETGPNWGAMKAVED